uniref:solute carrier family 35 member G1 isoform X4 n=2 Tax=Myxine glutinosa TaxID=7769 RepID=UPI00358FE49F
MLRDAASPARLRPCPPGPGYSLPWRAADGRLCALIFLLLPRRRPTTEPASTANRLLPMHFPSVASSPSNHIPPPLQCNFGCVLWVVMPKGTRIFLFLRGALGSTSMLLLYCTVRTIGLAEGILLSRLSPAITILFAWPVLGERWRRSDPPLLILAIVGVLLVVRPRSIFGSYADDQVENTSLHWQGTIMGIAAAVASSFTILVLRRLGGRKISVVLITWAYAVVGLVGSVIALLIVGGISERDGSSYPLTVIPNCGRDRWLVIATGVFGVCGQTLLAKALQLEDAGPVSIARSVDVAFAFLWHVTVLQLPLSFWSLGGAACITLCTSGLALRAFRSRNNPQK